MHLARRDHGGDPAVEPGLDEVHGSLTRGEVAEDGVTVRIDEPGDHRAALGVDDGVGLIFEPGAHGRYPAVCDGDAIALEERALDVTRDDQTDILDQRLHATVMNLLTSYRQVRAADGFVF